MAIPPIKYVARLDGAIKAAGVAILSINTTGSVDPPSLQAAAQPTIDAFDDSEAAQLSADNLAARTSANSLIDNSKTDLLKLLRAVAKVMVDELNVLRDDVIGVASQTWDPASMANATGLTSPNFTVTGAAFGDLVDPVAPYSLAGVTATAYVSAADTAVIRLHNGTGAAVNLASGSWSVIVRRHGTLAPRTLTQAKTAIKNEISAGNVD